jgi:hypothetical protein
MQEPLGKTWKVVLNGTVFGALFLTWIGLVWLIYYYTQPPPPDYEHWRERERNLAELRARDKEWLENYAWQDQSKGAVRLTITRALELMAWEWRHPEAGRSNLLARLEKYGLAPLPLPAAPTNAPAASIPAPKANPGAKP